MLQWWSRVVARRTEALQRLRRLPFGSLWKRLADFCSSHTGLYSFHRQSKSVPISGRLLLLVCLLILFFGYVAWHVGPWFPGQGSNLRPLHRKGSVLTTGPSGFFSIRDASLFHPSHKYSQEWALSVPISLTLWMLITSAISKYLLIHLFLPLECKLLEGTALSYHLGSTWHIPGALWMFVDRLCEWMESSAEPPALSSATSLPGLPSPQHKLIFSFVWDVIFSKLR